MTDDEHTIGDRVGPEDRRSPREGRIAMDGGAAGGTGPEPNDDETGDDPESGTGDGSAPESNDGVDDPGRRRWLVRILLAVGIGIPVVIEGRTFVKLIGERLLGGDDEGTPTGTPTERDVEVGDELLPGTAPAETVTDARLVATGEDTWTFSLTVEVGNDTDTVYELRLGSLTNAAGERIDGGATTGRIQPGGTVTVTSTWSVPPNVRPATVQVTAVIHGGENVTPSTVTEAVRLGRVQVVDPETQTGDG